MGIFGQLDAANIPTNPFYIEKGDYSAEVTDAKFKTNRDQVKQLYIQYTINDEDSQFLDSKAVQFFDLPDENMTQEMFSLLPSDEQRKMRRNLAALKRTLCGNDSNSSQKGLGVDQNDLNDPNWDPAVLMGTKVNLSITNYGATNEGVNIKWVNLQEDSE